MDLSPFRRQLAAALRRPEIRKALAACAVTGAAFVFLNAGYFWQRLTLAVTPPSGQSRIEVPATPEAPAARIPSQLEIRPLGITAPVIAPEEKNEAAFQRALQDGVVHYPGTALPGQPGNCYIFGHSSDYGWAPGSYKTIFARLPSIKIGDRVTVTDIAGDAFSYEVTETKVVSPSDLTVLEQDHSRRILTLQTSYPLGTALRRFIVIAELRSEEST